MIEPVVRPMGDRALLAEVGSLDEVLALHEAMDASRPDGIVELVPAARTVLLRVDPKVLSLAAASAWIRRAAAEATTATGMDADEVVLDVVYDGADLAETAELLGVSTDALVAAHTGATWQVAFTGFAPGFGYLVSHDWPYDVPRLASPRTRVPAGAIGLAAGFSGAYPRETPGGWRLIGRTAARLFDPDVIETDASPALLAPGMRVRFRAQPPVPEPVEGPSPAENSGRRLDRRGDRSGGLGDRSILRITAPGLFSTIQDLGRPGRAALGISRSGALDRSALRTANRLVGNPEDTAGIELAMGGLRAVATHDTWFAVTGADGPATIDGRPVDRHIANEWPAGAELRVDWFTHGARAYLAVRGGIDVPPPVGSRSTDTLAGLGPLPLSAGDELVVGPRPDIAIPITDLAPWGAPPDELVLELAAGPRADWFTEASRTALFESTWTVSAQADRVGIRLDGPELERTNAEELQSEGMVPGALQVPPSGRPTILLADGPVTGGYPVIAVVADASLDKLGQARPGTRIRFRHAR